MNGSEGGGWTGELLEWQVMASTPTLFSRDSQETVAGGQAGGDCKWC